MPDSLTKWEKPAEVKPTSGSTVTGPDGNPISVPAPSGGSGPSAISYSAASIDIKTGESVTITPTITGGSGAGGTSTDYIFSSYDASNPTATLNLSTMGLTMNAYTGVITGTPTSYKPATSFLIKCYHITSGTTVSTTLTLRVATDLNSLTLYYDQTLMTGSGGYGSLIIKVDTLGSFGTGPISINPGSGTGSGAHGTVTFVDTVNKELYVVVDPTSEAPGFGSGDQVDNSFPFVVAEGNITSVTYAVPTSVNFEFRPAYISDYTIGSDELPTLTWSISPSMPTGTNPIQFNTADVTGVDNGVFSRTNPALATSSLATTEYTVTVRNSINQTKQIKIKFNISNDPQELSYGNKALVLVDTNESFNVGDVISTNGSGSGVGKVIRKFSTDHMLIRVENGEFFPGDTLDNTYPYVAQRATIDSSSTVHLVNAQFIVPAATGSNFTAGEYVSSTTGTGRGVVVYNDTSYTKLLTLNIATATTWSAGDMVVGRSTVSESDTGVATVLRNGSSTLLVNMISGTFGQGLPGDYLQDRASYYDSDNDSGNGEQDNVMSNTAPTSYSTLYVRQISGAFTTGAGNDIDDAATYSVSAGTISYIDSDYVMLATPASAWGSAGRDFSTQNGEAVGTIDLVTSPASSTTAVLKVENGVLGADMISDGNPYSVGTNSRAVTTYKTFMKYGLDRGKTVTLKPALTQGDNVVYLLDTSGSGSAATTLPAGLTLNSSTGVINGTPTSPSSQAKYRIIAMNAVGSATHEFYMEVYDNFRLINLTSNAPSFILHKAGQGRQLTDCNISNKQLNTTGGYLNSKDIICFLEAGELDLYSSGLSFKADVGGGMCDFISIRPYQFYQWQYKKTGQHIPKVYYKYTKDAACTNCYNPKTGGAPVLCSSITDDPVPASGICDGNYYSLTHPSWPNCDDGEYITRTIVYTNTDAPDVTCTSSEYSSTDVSNTCGGKRSNCINGAAKDIFDVTKLELGIVSQVTASGTGLSKTWTFQSPSTLGYATNMYLTNFTYSNSCSNTSAGDNNFQYYANSWQKYADDTFYQVKMAGNTATSFTVGNSYVTDNAMNVTVQSIIDSTTMIVKPTSGSLATLNLATTLNGQNLLLTSNPAYINATVAYDVPQRNSQPYYDINCLNSSYDTIARIRLVVRDWNRDFGRWSRIDRIQPDITTTSIRDFMDVSSTDDFGNNYDNRADFDASSSPSLSSCGSSSTAPVAPISPVNPTYSSGYSFPTSGL